MHCVLPLERRTVVRRRTKMIKDNNPPQEQSAQEETPVSLDHDELTSSETEKVNGGIIAVLIGLLLPAVQKPK